MFYNIVYNILLSACSIGLYSLMNILRHYEFRLDRLTLAIVWHVADLRYNSYLSAYHVFRMVLYSLVFFYFV